MENLIYNVALTLAILLGALLASGLVWLIVKLIGTENMKKISAQLSVNQELAAVAVRYAQQVFWNQAGEIRYQKAAEWMSSQCQKYGITITSDQIKGLIEEALRAFKDEFGEDWGKAVAEPVKVGGTQ